jgi:hypothetical protein
MGALGTGKRIYKHESEWVKIKNTHASIVSEEIFFGIT